MEIAAVQKLTLLDFPQKTACIIFTPRCNFRCGFCHNAELVDEKLLKKTCDNLIAEEDFFAFLAKRKGMLDGVVITGGEPTLQKDLPVFLKKIKKHGFLVKLDTNGSNPQMLEQLLREGLLSYIALDIKASPENYRQVAGGNFARQVTASKNLIMQSGVGYEFRTTLVRELVDKAEWKKILKFVKGADKFFLQNLQSKNGCLDKKFANYHAFTKKELDVMCEEAKEFVRVCGVRS